MHVGKYVAGRQSVYIIKTSLIIMSEDIKLTWLQRVLNMNMGLITRVFCPNCQDDHHSYILVAMAVVHQWPPSLIDIKNNFTKSCRTREIPPVSVLGGAEGVKGHLENFKVFLIRVLLNY